MSIFQEFWQPYSKCERSTVQYADSSGTVHTAGLLPGLRAGRPRNPVSIANSGKRLHSLRIV